MKRAFCLPGEPGSPVSPGGQNSCVPTQNSCRANICKPNTIKKFFTFYHKKEEEICYRNQEQVNGETSYVPLIICSLSLEVYNSRYIDTRIEF